MKLIRRHLTFANVIACVALFVALGGVGYAALKLPKESVDTEQLKGGAVTPAKLSDKAKQKITGARGPQGQAGAQGPAGPAGPPGEIGPSSAYSYFHREEIMVPSLTAFPFSSLAVPAGSYAIEARMEALSKAEQLYIVGCFLTAGNDSDEVNVFLDNNQARFPPFRTLYDEQPLTMQLVHTFAGPGQITIGCYHEAGYNEIYMRDIRITAIKVGSIAAEVIS